jgi:hypothetical protein
MKEGELYCNLFNNFQLSLVIIGELVSDVNSILFYQAVLFLEVNHLL